MPCHDDLHMAHVVDDLPRPSSCNTFGCSATYFWVKIQPSPALAGSLLSLLWTRAVCETVNPGNCNSCARSALTLPRPVSWAAPAISAQDCLLPSLWRRPEPDARDTSLQDASRQRLLPPHQIPGGELPKWPQRRLLTAMLGLCSDKTGGCREITWNTFCLNGL